MDYELPRANALKEYEIINFMNLSTIVEDNKDLISSIILHYNDKIEED